MKKFITLMVFIGLTAIACQEQSSITESQIDQTNLFLSKKPDNTTSANARTLDLAADDLLTMTYLESYSKNLSIDGSKGGRISVEYYYPNSIACFKAILVVPRGAFQGVKDFNIVININDLSVSLEPTPFTFDRPVELTLKFEDINVSSFNFDTSTFNYLDPEGNNEKVEYQFLDIGPNYIWVTKAKLYHFSRYGFVK